MYFVLEHFQKEEERNHCETKCRYQIINHQDQIINHQVSDNQTQIHSWQAKNNICPDAWSKWLGEQENLVWGRKWRAVKANKGPVCVKTDLSPFNKRSLNLVWGRKRWVVWGRKRRAVKANKSPVWVTTDPSPFNKNSQNLVWGRKCQAVKVGSPTQCFSAEKPEKQQKSPKFNYRFYHIFLCSCCFNID